MAKTMCDLKQCIHYKDSITMKWGKFAFTYEDLNLPVSQWKKECQECWHSNYYLGYGSRCNFATINEMIGRTELSNVSDSEIIEEAKKRGLL
jgi:hypothetical protein